MGLHQKGRTTIETKIAESTEATATSLSPLLLFTCYVVWNLCLPDCRSVCKIMGLKLKCDTEWQYKMCNNVAIRSGDSGTEHTFLDINCRKTVPCAYVSRCARQRPPTVPCTSFTGVWSTKGRRNDSWVTRKNNKLDETLRRNSMYMAVSILAILSCRIFLQIEARVN